MTDTSITGTRRTRSALGSSRRVELLDALQRHGACTVGELAAETGLHENTTREHLQRLIAEGYVRRERGTPAGRGRPRMQYRATRPSDVHQDPGALRRLEESIAQAALAQALLDGYGRATSDVAGAAREDGVRIGRDLDTARPAAPEPDGRPSDERQVLALDAHLDRMGFDPVLERETMTFHLWRCPFLELARDRPDVVCSVHLGLAQGVLDQVGGPVRADRLQPFVGPEHCTLRLRVEPD